LIQNDSLLLQVILLKQGDGAKVIKDGVKAKEMGKSVSIVCLYEVKMVMFGALKRY